jgi:glycosyltransferase involved in cell wall biosynthesis
MMKILVVCRVYPTHVIGGMPIAARMHAQALAMRGHKVTFATTLHPSGKAFMEMDNDVEVHYLPGTHIGVADDYFDIALVQFFEAGDFDCVLSESTGAGALTDRVPVSAFLHGYQMEGAFNSLAEFEDTGDAALLEEAKRYLVSGFAQRHALSQYAAVAALSDNCYRDLTQKLFLTNVYRVNNCIDTDLFQSNGEFNILMRKAWGIPDGNKVVLTACHLIRFKGVHHLLRAMEKLPENVTVVICGIGPMTGELKSLADPYGSRVIFTKEIANEDMPKYYNMADVFFSGSYHYSGLDMNVLEALACGCPVVGCLSPGKANAICSDSKLTYSLSERDNLHDRINFALDEKNREWVQNTAEYYGKIVRNDYALEVTGARLEMILKGSLK